MNEQLASELKRRIRNSMKSKDTVFFEFLDEHHEELTYEDEEALQVIVDGE
jgi:hypothetical protein